MARSLAEKLEEALIESKQRGVSISPDRTFTGHNRGRIVRRNPIEIAENYLRNLPNTILSSPQKERASIIERATLFRSELDIKLP